MLKRKSNETKGEIKKMEKEKVLQGKKKVFPVMKLIRGVNFAMLK